MPIALVGSLVRIRGIKTVIRAAAYSNLYLQLDIHVLDKALCGGDVQPAWEHLLSEGRQRQSLRGAETLVFALVLVGACRNITWVMFLGALSPQNL